MAASDYRPSQGKTTSSRSLIWAIPLVIVTLRTVNSLTVKTFFQPDEYFQSLEPAWQLAFGAEGRAWITWEWREQLRSALHPLVFAAVYRAAAQLANLFHLNPAAQASLLIAAPKLLQASFASVMDYHTWKLGRLVYGDHSHESSAALALTVFSPWQWYCSTRTFSNTVETTLTVVGLALWPWQKFIESDKGPLVDDSRLNLALLAAATACILRPTNAIVWASVVATLLLRHGTYQKLTVMLQSAVFSGLSVLAVSIAVDRAYFGAWALPPLRFLYFNVVQSLSVFYGRNRRDYYFTEGLPLLLTTALPFAVIGFWQSLRPGADEVRSSSYCQRQTRFVLALAVASTVLAFSAIAHKEMRFIYPLLPILHILAARPMAAYFAPFPIPRSNFRRALLLVGLAVNAYVAAYVTLVHQRGVIDVMHFMRHEAESGHQVRNITVGFFMPCHSTPWRSHLVHPEIHAWALTCEPPIHRSAEEQRVYLDEADVFYADPEAWMDDNMEPRGTISQSSQRLDHVSGRRWPDYLVYFEQLEPTMRSVLGDTGYSECWRGFNTHWIDDGRRRGDVIVQCTDRKGSAA